MPLDIAYSIEANDYLDPDRAYDLYWSGLITDKKKFLCPGSDCTAQVTCANLDEDVQDMKVVPHFRIYGSHSKSCEIFNNVPLDLRYEVDVVSVYRLLPNTENCRIKARRCAPVKAASALKFSVIYGSLSAGLAAET